MRSSEIALAGVAAVAVFMSLFQRSRNVAFVLALLSLCLLCWHLFVDGWRLQAMPIYLAVFTGSALCFPQVPNLARITGAALTLSLACVGLLACYCLPVISLPTPDGPLSIGTETFFLRDTSRTEQYGPERGGPRRVAFQIWYPTTQRSGRTALYRDPRSLYWKTYHLRSVKTHAYTGAPPLRTGAPWPVVLFSPSSGGYRSQDTFLTENLVSHGYAVIAFDHADTSSRVAFPDGFVARSLPDVWLDLDSRAALARSMPKVESTLATNVDDMLYALNQLQSCQPDTPFRNLCEVMDFGKVAAVGHSFGGAAAAELCRRDSRFRAGVNMDGWMFSAVNSGGVPKPFLFMVDDSAPLQPTVNLAKDRQGLPRMDAWPDNMAGLGEWGDQYFRAVIQQSTDRWGGCSLRLFGASHASFADMILYRRPLPWKKEEGLDPVTGHRMISVLVRAFLDETLKGQHGRIAASAALFPQQIELKCHTAGVGSRGMATKKENLL